MRRRNWTVGAIAVATMLAAGGVAYATIPDSGGTIHGCYARSGGSLRVIDDTVTNCKSTETSLNWNVQGQPQGAPGPQGPQGATGPQGQTGASGLSHAYATSVILAPVANAPADSTVATIANVPAGTYLVWGQVRLASSSDDSGKCQIAVNGSADSSSTTFYKINSSIGNLTIVTPETLTGGGSTVGVVCSNFDSGTDSADVHLALVTVDALN